MLLNRVRTAFLLLSPGRGSVCCCVRGGPVFLGRGLMMQHSHQVVRWPPPSTTTSVRRLLSSSSSPSSVQSPPAKSATPTRWSRIKAELVHYYHGFCLFFVELKIASKLLWKLGRGRQLSRREQRHMNTTLKDVIRLVPFMVFIIVPFMEFLLPVYLKFFPNALPSTFAQQSKGDGKKEARMKKDYQVASILRDVLLEHASGLGKAEYVDFLSFMEKVRSPETAEPTPEEVLKFANLFENDLTLNSLNRINLICICELLDLPTLGPNMMLRGLIHSRIRRLEGDDRLILRDGIGTLTTSELQKACRARGMAYFGLDDDRLRFQLKQWTDFSLNRKVPISLLLLSRAFFFAPRPVPAFLQPAAEAASVVDPSPSASTAADFLKGVIGSLPVDVEQATAWKLAELAGQRVPNKEKLLAVKKEDDAIKSEQAEAAAAAAPAEKRPPERVGAGVADQLAQALIELASRKNIDLSTVEIDDYVEEKGGAAANAAAAAAVERNEAAAVASRTRAVLGRKIGRMLSNVNRLHAELHQKRTGIQANIRESEERSADEPSDAGQLIESISTKRQSLVHLNEVLDVIERLKPDNTTTSPAELRDAVVENLVDQDNKIDVLELFKVLQYMNREHIELSKETLEEVSETIAAENSQENPQKKLNPPD